jgi:hypothetical protein
MAARAGIGSCRISAWSAANGIRDESRGAAGCMEGFFTKIIDDETPGNTRWSNQFGEHIKRTEYDSIVWLITMY